MIRRLAAVTAAAALLTTRPASAQAPIAGSTIGAPIEAVSRVLGPPADVASLDSGHRFLFATGAVYVDDDAIVLGLDLRAGSATIEIDGVPKTFAIGTYPLGRADAELAAVAEFAAGSLRSYRLAPRRDLVLVFFPDSNRLERIVYGEPGQLARLGLLPGDAATKAVPYRAPVLRHGLPATGETGSHVTVFRLGVDRAGALTRVEVVIPSDVPRLDDDLAHRLESNRYAPATLGGRPIAATVYIRVRQ